MDDSIVSDWEMTKKRYEAFWLNEMIDRPVTHLTCAREKPRWPLHDLGGRSAADLRDQYLDPQYRVEVTENAVASTDYFGDAVPVARRGINTAYLGSFAGIEPRFSDIGGVWIEPCVDGWDSMTQPVFNPESRVFRRILAVSDALAANSRGRYLLAIPDHLDAVTSMSQMRGVERFCLDIVDAPEAVYAYRDALVRVWLESFDFWWKRDHEYGFEGTNNWAGAFSARRAGVLECDFSYMISPAMFEDLVRPELVAESNHLDASLYHWDGRGQVCHFDLLRSIPKLTAFQWVPGDGTPSVAEWPDPALLAQRAGHPVQLCCDVSEVEQICSIFEPRGVFLNISHGENDKLDGETCRTIMKRIERWAAGR